MYSSQQLSDILRAHGYKVTPQRIAVYEELVKEKHWHPSAEALYSRLQPRFPSMSFATVYKAVDILAKVGAIEIINVGEDSFRYDANIQDHHHVICEQCGAIMDVDLKGQCTLNDCWVKEVTGYKIRARKCFLYGTCPECLKKQ